MSFSISAPGNNAESLVSNPEPEPVFIGKEGTPSFIKSVVWIIIDLFLTIFLIAVQYGLFMDKLEVIKLIVISSVAFILFAIILIFVLSHVTILVIIAKYAYMYLGGIYYGYRLIMMIIFLIQNESEITNLDLIIFILVLSSVIPRISGFHNIEQLAKVCQKVDESRRILEHEKFVERIGNKIDKGGYSRWSNTLEIEKTSNANFSPVKDNNKK